GDDRRLALVAKAYCTIAPDAGGEKYLVLVAQDPNDALGAAADSYRLTVFVQVSALRPGSAVKIKGSFLERYVDADGHYRDYAQSSDGEIMVKDSPTVGEFLVGYVDVKSMTACPNAPPLPDGGVANCFTPPFIVPEADLPDEADP